MRGVGSIAMLMGVASWLLTGDANAFVAVWLMSLFVGGFLVLILRPFL